MNFHINSIESFSAHPDGHSCLAVTAQPGVDSVGKKGSPALSEKPGVLAT